MLCSQPRPGILEAREPVTDAFSAPPRRPPPIAFRASAHPSSLPGICFERFTSTTCVRPPWATVQTAWRACKMTSQQAARAFDRCCGNVHVQSLARIRTHSGVIIYAPGQRCPGALCVMTECSRSVLSDMVATSHMCLLSTWKVATATEELNFSLYFIKWPRVASGHRIECCNTSKSFIV